MMDAGQWVNLALMEHFSVEDSRLHVEPFIGAITVEI